ncbi:hypothetical protein NPIL_623181 [Nephila pilipes]|uniref:Uncharacterized protein n=1 Tax=Nephila pilipes TaxID=299642 RepID=A0A8X6TUD2_NEPPI|nr:hypothetical protein NPIL_623181 [Nephila pilipes]
MTPFLDFDNLFEELDLPAPLSPLPPTPVSSPLPMSPSAEYVAESPRPELSLAESVASPQPCSTETTAASPLPGPFVTKTTVASVIQRERIHKASDPVPKRRSIPHVLVPMMAKAPADIHP